MSTVRLENVAKQFGTTAVVRNVSLEIAEGELVALLGPSGSGKTTLLRLIAGFEAVNSGRILLDGDDVTARSALERRCGMVFQHYALFPHLTVGENVAYGLARERLDRGAREARVTEVLALVDLAGFEDRAVTALSGGQQQRVALARALAPRPRVLLLDEPLSNLDPSLRERTRRELRDLLHRTGITSILVTHEQEEAFDLADRVVVLHLGHLEQIGTPEVLYSAPATPFVASFVGRASALPATVTTDGVVTAAGARWQVAANGHTGAAVLLVRPEGVRFAANGPITGTVVRRRFAGAVVYCTLALADGNEIEVAAAAADAAVGDTVRAVPAGGAAFLFAEPGR
ncbi:MAG TPA: ABC transporter ATP-binding protein [Gemmatimonadales bacterium]|nr:ABC transporter ATP-binding protein [Gemmatimonadales bacterium]